MSSHDIDAYGPGIACYFQFLERMISTFAVLAVVGAVLMLTYSGIIFD
jgi:hypothetical protein